MTFILIRPLRRFANRNLTRIPPFSEVILRPQFRALHANPKGFTDDESRDFTAIFPDIVRELTIEGVYKNLPTVNKHLAQVIQNNVPRSNRNPGMAVPLSYKMLTDKSLQTEENLRLANILGWCVEFLQASFLVVDDITQALQLRVCQPNWYTKEELCMVEPNDALLLEACIFTLLESHFKDKPYFYTLLIEFHQATRDTCMGKALALATPKLETIGQLDIESIFDMKVYTSIVKFKSSYTFCLPGSLAMTMAGINDPHVYQQAKAIYLEMGHFLQVQDDFFNCFSDPKVTGRSGTDIQDGKLSWLISVALQRANSQQRKVLRKCYGSLDPENVAKVKQIYEDLKLRHVYIKFEESLYEDIMLRVNQIKGEGHILPPKLFTTFLDKIYKREH